MILPVCFVLLLDLLGASGIYWLQIPFQTDQARTSHRPCDLGPQLQNEDTAFTLHGHCSDGMGAWGDDMAPSLLWLGKNTEAADSEFKQTEE